MVALLPLILVHVLTGSFAAILKDHMLAMQIDGKVVNFNYPLLWSLLYMIGMAVCLPLSSRRKCDAPMKELVLLSLLETGYAAACNLAFYALVGSHILTIVRGGEVLCTFALSQLVFRRKVLTHHWVGLMLTFGGVTCMGSCAFSAISPQHGELSSAEHFGNVRIGLMFCACAQILGAGVDVYSEVVVKQYDIDSIQLVGLTGVFGIPIATIGLLLVNIFGIESTPASLHQILHSEWLMLCVGALVLIQSAQSTAGVSVGKHGTAVVRSCSGMSRIVVVWLVEVFFGWSAFTMLQFCSMIMVGVGTLIYSRILTLPLLPMELSADADVCTGSVVKKQVPYVDPEQAWLLNDDLKCTNNM
eukprot:TRINITY_DN24165_c0_g1_i1.p1 TRINITY_DN24165_c0_g1~~TRINITY_DN24165_c0_g1_i1.p1  ORF type:complete len:359 (+),score=41.99 TRINITY_DN24165_c0_g1_i1:101-1177(+)